jgi:hypothetical protein
VIRTPTIAHQPLEGSHRPKEIVTSVKATDERDQRRIVRHQQVREGCPVYVGGDHVEDRMTCNRPVHFEVLSLQREMVYVPSRLNLWTYS